VGGRCGPAARPAGNQHRREHDEDAYGLDPPEQPQGEVGRDHGQVAEQGPTPPLINAAELLASRGYSPDKG
jgi:hypothetical protein